MKRYKHIRWTGKREYADCTVVVACKAERAPNGNWVECSDAEWPQTAKALWTECGVQYWGWL
jgi:hypothetical protein